jgi:hypothetical protein
MYAQIEKMLSSRKKIDSFYDLCKKIRLVNQPKAGFINHIDIDKKP